MDDLIERLEKASGPDRQIDNDIWALLNQPLPDDPAGCPAHYTASIDAALTLVPEGFAVDISVYDGGRGDARLWADQRQPISTRVGPNRPASPPIALCIVALKARQSANTPVWSASEIDYVSAAIRSHGQPESEAFRRFALVALNTLRGGSAVELVARAMEASANPGADPERPIGGSHYMREMPHWCVWVEYAKPAVEAIIARLHRRNHSVQ